MIATRDPHAVAERMLRAVPDAVIEADALTLSQYAHDASTYRVPPLLVAFPRDADQVSRLLAAAQDLAIPVTCRGSGTSMAGNAIGPGMVLDFSRSMTRVVAVDPQAARAVVQPGVILDDLQRAAGWHGLMFGPDPSSHSRATLGGMLGNDACGNHSVAYGRTSDHVVELELVLADGLRVIAGDVGLRPVHAGDAERVAVLDARLRALVHANLATIRTELGTMSRQVSGYQMHHLLPENGFNVARAIVGSEGTVAVIVAATVKLVPIPPITALAVLGYRDLAVAAEDVPDILRHQPAAIEAMDTALVETMRARRGAASVAGLPDGDAWLYVEFSGDDPLVVQDSATALVASMQANGRAVSAQLVQGESERRSLWRVREDGAGLAATLIGGGRAWSGWEDAAVPPDELARYLREFRALLAEYHYTGVLYGHFGAGCVHVRIDFDLATDTGRARMTEFLEAAAKLVSARRGSLSGEHGDGRARSALLPTMYSSAAMRCFADFKATFDPQTILNPGIIVNASPLESELQDQPADASTAFAFHADRERLGHAVGRCVGIGRCVSSTAGVMCPSYRATRRESDSTRGRARALQDLLSGAQPSLTTSDALRTLDLCLSCKACSSDCPTGVDMARYKSELLHQHYRRRLRPRTHYSLGWLPTATRLAAPASGLVNAALRQRSARRLVAALAGVTNERELPPFVSRRVRRRELESITDAADASRAVLAIDTFTRAFRPGIASAASRVLASAEVPITVGPSFCCGLTWITTGQLTRARRVLARTVRRLSRPEFVDKPIIVLEPSCAATLADDLPELIATPEARRIAGRIMTFDHALHRLPPPTWAYPQLPANGVLQTHCHEYAVFSDHRQGDSLRAHGMAWLDEAVGCCGLAGNFGYEAEHYATSMAVAELSLEPALSRADPSTLVLADGFGCRTQIQHVKPDARPVHLAEALDSIIRQTTPEGRTRD